MFIKPLIAKVKNVIIISAFIMDDLRFQISLHCNQFHQFCRLCFSFVLQLLRRLMQWLITSFSGHCRNDDFDSAEGIMSIMSESGIDVGTESHLTLLVGMIRAGKSLAEVEAKMTKATRDSNVVFGDNEIFRLVVELIRVGKKVRSLLALPAPKV